MMGMNQVKKKLYTGLAIGLGIGLLMTGAAIFWGVYTINTYKNETNKKYIQEYMTKVCVLNRDVTQGEIIDSSMYTVKNVRKDSVPATSKLITNISGMVANYNIPANLAITTDMVTTGLVDADTRMQEVNTVLMPSDLVEGEYIDVRLTFPNGTDYVVLAQKRVEKIEGQTMWIQLNEDERLLLNSAVVDSYLTSGSKLYATTYVDSSQTVMIDYATLESISSESKKTTEDESEETKAEKETTTTTTPTVSDSKITSENVTSIVKGYMNNAIKDKLSDLKSDDEAKVTETVLNLIIKYRNYAAIATRTIENYQPNQQVIDMMKANANIIDEAKAKLKSDVRQNMENYNSEYKSGAGDDYENVVSGAEESISAQQSQRDTILGEQTAAEQVTE